LVTFVLLVRPALLHMQGWRGTGHGGFAGVLGEGLRNDGGRRHFVRVLFDQEGKLRSAGFQASHRLGSLPAAVGLVDLPPGAQYEPGRSVHVIPF
jgi:molybdopterin biosynthesis enzyme